MTCIRSQLLVLLVAFSLFAAGCGVRTDSRYFGLTKPPTNNIMRYVTGGEIESLDPPITNSQPDARILIALFDGLVEYHPKTMEPIPSIAQSWELSQDGTEYIFHLRNNAKFSNGDPITSNDFVYSFRRGFDPKLASRNAYLGYYIKYSEAYNSDKSFVKDPTGKFLLKSDVEDKKEGEGAPATPKVDNFGPDSEFHRFLDGPERLTVPSDPKDLAKLTDKDAKLKAALQGKELVPVKAEDIGVEAIDPYTLRVKLYQPAPFFLGLLAHQFFRVVDHNVVEKYGKDWTRTENIVTSGAYKLTVHKPYDVLSVRRDPNNWDAANVHLDGIDFYPLDEQTTMMNLYKAGSVDALYNHTVPAAWFDQITPFKAEYSLQPEVADEFYVMNVKKPPMDKLKVRQALSLAIDRDALAKFRKTLKPLVDMTPEGIFPKYEEARTKIYTEELAKQGSNLDQWKARKFDPGKARKLMTEAGFPVNAAGDGFACPSFPTDQVNLTYNTAESNKAVAEFVQAQWRQNLGITIPLQSVEFRTYLDQLNKVDYAGVARRGWVGDYMDPYTFLSLYYSPANEGATGWWDPKFDKLLDDANNTVDPQKRFEILAQAEFYVMQQQIIIPLGTNTSSWMKKPYVKGFYPNPGTLEPWKFAYIEQDPSKWTTDMDKIMSDDDPAVSQQVDRLMATQLEMQNSKTQIAAK
ncbi:MAG: peptide ABC transporter substrate-binding protein [Acidobacteria bacterium]|nr:peptide ABC transporter substrate-binding protein [Acidobacteriota bacterium]